MRNNYIVKILFPVFLALSGLTACKGKTDKAGQLYTCPMHPQITRDKPGKCPICGMDLVLKDTNKELVMDSNIARFTKPVNAQVIATIPAIYPKSGTRIYSSAINGIITYDTRNQASISSRVGGRVERLLIKYNYQSVKRGQLIMEVYSQDLAAAQRELLYVAHNSPEMLAGAKQRLQLLGMQPAQIDQVLRTGNILYRVPVYSSRDGYILEKTVAGSTRTSTAPSSVTSGDGMGGMSTGATPAQQIPAATPVLLREGQYVSAGQSLFTIYQANALVAEFALTPQLAARIKRGQKLLFFPTSDDKAIQSGSIGLIEPVFRNGVNFTLARVYLTDNNFQVGQLLTANVPIVYTEGWWLPKKSVWHLGNKSIVFRKDKDVYVPVEVATGAEVEDMIQVNTNIGGWQVASSAYYLVDSESFIKPNN